MKDAELLLNLKESVVNMEEDETRELSEICIEENIEPFRAISEGLAMGMKEAGDLYEEGEYYIPELLMCSDAMYAGLEVLKPKLKREGKDNNLRAIVGVVEGDTHDIGKNLFKIMLETNGFEVLDLGRDVSPREFIKKAREFNANLIGMSTLMTTTMDNMQVVMNLLKEEGMRDNIVVMVGGGPISQNFADKIGADGYAPEASRAAKLAKNLVKEKCLSA
ncbi:corrinoid protein [Clostridium sp.]|uniref:corrinoid protein n=1 Tax=Clostridium sp. TaxID=1506 RepID=UPI0034646B44